MYVNFTFSSDQRHQKDIIIYKQIIKQFKHKSVILRARKVNKLYLGLAHPGAIKLH